MGIIGIVGAFLLIFCFASTKERVKSVNQDHKIRFSDIFEQFRKNRPLVVLSIFFVLIFGINSINSSIGIYYITYNVGRPDLVKWYTVLGSLPAFICVPLIPKLNDRFGKKALLNGSLVITVIGTLSLFVILVKMVGLILFSRVFTAIVLGCFGYIANHAQTPHALIGILITATIIPGILMLLAIIDINFYNLDDKKYAEIVNALKEKAMLKVSERG